MAFAEQTPSLGECERVLGRQTTLAIFARVAQERAERPLITNQELETLILGEGYGDEIYYTYNIPAMPEHEEVVECVQNIIRAPASRVRPRSNSPEIHDPHRKSAKRGKGMGMSARRKKSKKRKARIKQSKARRKRRGRSNTRKKRKASKCQ